MYPNVDYFFDPVVIAEEFFWVSSIGGSFTADILSISVFRKKINIKLHHLNAELENANKTKMRFFGILNYDLRSPVVGLIHFLKLKKDAPELLDEEIKNRLENQTFKSAENLLVQMEDLLLWSKGQMDHFQPEKKIIFGEGVFEENKKKFWGEDRG